MWISFIVSIVLTIASCSAWLFEQFPWSLSRLLVCRFVMYKYGYPCSDALRALAYPEDGDSNTLRNIEHR